MTTSTQVVIIGAGPAGSLLSLLLHAAGVESVVLEQRSRDYVLGRIRAGVLEAGTNRVLCDLGVGDRMVSDGEDHEGVVLSKGERRLRIDFRRLADAAVTIYGQTQVQYDLYDAMDQRGVVFLDEAEGVAINDLDGDRPSVTFTRHGEIQRIEAEFIAGCDGYHGVSRASIPDGVLRTYERIYPFGWLGILSETPPIHHELIYASHERGFALCSMRNPMLSRYYVQCDLDDDTSEWSDDRFWSELTARLPSDVTPDLVTGPSIEKSIAPLRSFVAEPLRYNRLFLAGDAAHIVPPTGAKGLNLAVSDVVYLAEALVDHARTGSWEAIEGYSDRALTRVWASVRFSWWMTTLMHRFPDGDGFTQRIADAEFEQLVGSEAAQQVLAENYVGLPI